MSATGHRDEGAAGNSERGHLILEAVAGNPAGRLCELEPVVGMSRLRGVQHVLREAGQQQRDERGGKLRLRGPFGSAQGGV